MIILYYLLIGIKTYFYFILWKNQRICNWYIVYLLYLLTENIIVNEKFDLYKVVDEIIGEKCIFLDESGKIIYNQILQEYRMTIQRLSNDINQSNKELSQPQISLISLFHYYQLHTKLV